MLITPSDVWSAGRPGYRSAMSDHGETHAVADSNATAAGAGSGRGGDLGAPSTKMPAEEPPSSPEERNNAVSGGGIANATEGDDPGPDLHRDGGHDDR